MKVHIYTDTKTSLALLQQATRAVFCQATLRTTESTEKLLLGWKKHLSSCFPTCHPLLPAHNSPTHRSSRHHALTQRSHTHTPISYSSAQHASTHQPATRHTPTHHAPTQLPNTHPTTTHLPSYPTHTPPTTHLPNTLTRT